MSELVLNLMNTFLTVCCIFLAVLDFFAMAKAIKGPTVSDRIVAVNMIGTLTIMIIGMLAVLLGQNYLVDICLIYAMISFLAVVVLCKIYMGVYLEKKKKEEKK